MFKPNVLEIAQSMFISDLQLSVGFGFSHHHNYVGDDYSVELEIHTVIDPDNGKFVPMMTLNQKSNDVNKRPTLFRITNRTFFTVNGSTGIARQLDPLHSQFVDKLIEHGLTDSEIEIIKSILFSINIYIKKQDETN